MRKLTKQEFVDRSIELHGDKYDYSLVNYIDINTHVILSIDGITYSQSPSSHLQGKCPENIHLSTRKSKEQFIIESKQINGDKYDYSLVEYISNYKKVILICNKCSHKFGVTPINNIFRRSECPKCSKIESKTKMSSNNSEFIQKCILLNKNIYYSFDKIEYINNKIKVIITCKKHGDFLVKPNYFLLDRGCSKCSRSKGETRVSEVLNKLNINFNVQKTFEACVNVRKLEFDFYLPDYNVCIEFDGQQHFKPIKRFGGDVEFKNVKKRDEIKNKYCLENNIKLIRIPYYDFNNTEEILKKELNINE
jgi:hypothetical protein